MKINSVTIVEPEVFVINSEKIAQRSRLTSGKMVVDVRAIKRNFALNYTKGLRGSDLLTILDQFTTNEFVTFEFTPEAGTGTEEATVYIENVPRTLRRIINTTAYYGGVSVALMEQ